MPWFQYFTVGGPLLAEPLVCKYFYTILVLPSVNKAFTYLGPVHTSHLCRVECN